MLSATTVHPITATHDWIVGHPVTAMVALAVLSALFSIYGSDIRSFLHVSTPRAFRKGNRNTNVKRLQTLEYLHNNPYRLVLFLAMSFLHFLRQLAFDCLILAVIYVAVFRSSSGIPFFGILVGVGFSSLQQTLFLLDDLMRFDESSVRLRTAIAKDEAKLDKAR